MNTRPLVSIITVVYNNIDDIEKSIQSVLSQDYAFIEYVIIDGCSTDGTVEIIRAYKEKISIFISEPDDGIYYAMNKGIKLASGDIIGILNSDDVFADNNIISNIVEEFILRKIDLIWGDIVFFDKKKKIRRFYSGKDISPSSFNYGIMPPHPAVFIKKECYEKFGYFNTIYRIAADYDLLFRFIKLNKLKYAYLPKVCVKMKIGGISNSSISSLFKLNKEIYQIHHSNGVPIKITNLIKKIPNRIFELFNRP